MEYRKVLAVLSIMGISGLTTLAAPPKVEESPKPRQPATAEQRNDAREDQRDVARTDGQQQTAWRNGDHFLASCVAIENQEEIALAQWAEQKLQSNEAKEFARMLVKDHSDFLTKLQQHAPEATRENFLTSAGTTQRSEQRPDDQNRDSRAQPAPRPGVAPNNANNDPNNNPNNNANNANTEKRIAGNQHSNQAGNLNVDLMQLHREIADQCLADTKEMLGQKSEKEVDACFVGLQIAKHAAMKTKLEVFQRHATGELKEILAKGASTTSTHLEHAEKLMKQLNDASTRTAAK
jgi:hypothetical protein